MESIHLTNHWQAGWTATFLTHAIEREGTAGYLAKALREVRERTEQRQFRGEGQIWRGRRFRALNPKYVDPLLDLIVQAEVVAHARLPGRYKAEIRDGMRALAYLVTRWADPAAIEYVDRMPLLHALTYAEILEGIARRITLRSAIEHRREKWGHRLDLDGWRHAG